MALLLPLATMLSLLITVEINIDSPSPSLLSVSQADAQSLGGAVYRRVPSANELEKAALSLPHAWEI